MPLATTPNPNLHRRPGLGLALALAWPVLKPLSLLLSRRRPRPDGGVTVFQSYLVGDFYMGLPAILRLARHVPVTVLCRPDCVHAFAGTGVEAIPFANPGFLRPGPGAFLASFRNALALRGRLAGAALDQEADPRTALLLKAAGLGPVMTWGRRFAWFFDRTFPLPAAARSTAARDHALSEAWLAHTGAERKERTALPDSSGPPAAPAPDPAAAGSSLGGSPWAPPRGLLLSVWTRKDTKNWPLDHWDLLVGRLIGLGHSLTVLVPPDGDAGFQAFRARWEGRVGFLEGDLRRVERAAREAAGIVCTDNFLGHMGAFLGTPVAWINGSSDPEHVGPRGAEVIQKEPMPCRPCLHRCVNRVHRQCLVELLPEEVSARLEAWLEGLAPSRTPA